MVEQKIVVNMELHDTKVTYKLQQKETNLPSIPYCASLYVFEALSFTTDLKNEYELTYTTIR